MSKDVSTSDFLEKRFRAHQFLNFSLPSQIAGLCCYEV
jgi:hypothetical protein